MLDSVSLFSQPLSLNFDVVRLLLRKNNLRQKAVARHLGLSEAHFCQTLKGNYPISKSRLLKLGRLLRVEDVSILICGGYPCGLFSACRLRRDTKA